MCFEIITSLGRGEIATSPDISVEGLTAMTTIFLKNLSSTNVSLEARGGLSEDSRWPFPSINNLERFAATKSLRRLFMWAQNITDQRWRHLHYVRYDLGGQKFRPDIVVTRSCTRYCRQMPARDPDKQPDWIRIWCVQQLENGLTSFLVLWLYVLTLPLTLLIDSYHVVCV